MARTHEDSEKVICKVCGLKEATKFGKIPTQKWGQKQRYRCTKCATTFYKKEVAKKDVNLEDSNKIDISSC